MTLILKKITEKITKVALLLSVTLSYAGKRVFQELKFFFFALPSRHITQIQRSIITKQKQPKKCLFVYTD